MRLEGLVPPVVTPRADAGGVDRAALRSFVGALREAGVHGLFACGSAGEFASLATGQRRAAFEAAVAASGDRPVIAGCGHTTVPDTRELIDAAADAGADAAAVITPYAFGANQAGLREFYELVADDAALPIYLYNNPHVGARLGTDTVLDLAEHDRIVGIKESRGDLAAFRDVVAGTPDGFAVLQGSTTLAVASLDAGADGFVAGSSNVVPRAAAALYEAHRDGDRARAAALMNGAILPAIGAIREAGDFIAGIKHLVGLNGHDVGEPFPPRTVLDDAARGRLDERHADLRDAVAALLG